MPPGAGAADAAPGPLMRHEPDVKVKGERGGGVRFFYAVFAGKFFGGFWGLTGSLSARTPCENNRVLILYVDLPQNVHTTWDLDLGAFGLRPHMGPT